MYCEATQPLHLPKSFQGWHVGSRNFAEKLTQTQQIHAKPKSPPCACWLPGTGLSVPHCSLFKHVQTSLLRDCSLDLVFFIYQSEIMSPRLCSEDKGPPVRLSPPLALMSSQPGQQMRPKQLCARTHQGLLWGQVGVRSCYDCPCFAERKMRWR